MREGFRERLATLGLGLENRLTDRIGLLGRPAPGREPADGGAAALAHPAA